jgi:hypothetical protein
MPLVKEDTFQPQARNRRALIVGGSIAGLFAAAFLRRIGWQVDIYERSSIELIGRGVGIFAGHFELLEALDKCLGFGVAKAGAEAQAVAHALPTTMTLTVGLPLTMPSDSPSVNASCSMRVRSARSLVSVLRRMKITAVLHLSRRKPSDILAAAPRGQRQHTRAHAMWFERR